MVWVVGIGELVLLRKQMVVNNDGLCLLQFRKMFEVYQQYQSLHDNVDKYLASNSYKETMILISLCLLPCDTFFFMQACDSN